MLRFFACCLLICISCGLSAQSLVDTPVLHTSLSMNMAGKVDSITEFVMDVKVLEVGANAKVVAGTDSMVVTTVPDTSLLLQQQKAWKFDKRGRLLKESVSEWDSRKSELHEVSSTEYDYRDGKVQYRLDRKEGRLTDSVVFVFSRSGLRMCELYDARGKYTGRKQFFTNRDNMLSTISNKNEKLELTDMTKLWYNDDKVLKEATFHDKDQRLVMTKKYEVKADSAARRHVMIFEYAKPDTCTGMQSFVIDEMGNHWEDVTQDDKGNVLHYSTAVFNAYGHKTEESNAMKGLKITCTYEYDDQQNWTMKRVYHNGAPYKFYRRTITYYE